MSVRSQLSHLLLLTILCAAASCAGADPSDDTQVASQTTASLDAGDRSSPDAAAPVAAINADAGTSEVALACPASALPPGDTTRTLQVGGTSRSFRLHVPRGYTGKAAVPFVIDMHGLGGSGAVEEQQSGYKALSDQEGFIIAWPNGLDNAWNVGPCCTRSRTVDDVAFARAIVADLKARACIDAKRVYATGISMGGGMSHHLACNAADVFAAVAPAAFDLLADEEQPCKPARPITVITFRGTSDPIVPYAGGASRPPNGLNVTIHFLGAEKTFQRWAQLNGCTGTPTPIAGGCKTYAACKGGTAVTLCTKQGGSHEGGDPKVGWAMLKAHPML